MWREFEYDLEDEYETETYGGSGWRDFGEYERVGFTDGRVLASNTLSVPFCFVCCLEITFVNPNDGRELPLRASGTLISDRHVLTAAHVVFDDKTSNNLPGTAPFPPNPIRADSIIVIPARNGRRLPVSYSTITRARVSTQWQAAAERQARGGASIGLADAEFDFALLTLSQPLGAVRPVSLQLNGPPLGHWAHRRLGSGTRINPRSPGDLQNQRVNISGYPVDKCLDQPANGSATSAQIVACMKPIPDMEGLHDWGSTQWTSLGRVVEGARAGAPGLITYNLDTAPGHSGGPVWLRWQNFRNLIAIHTRSFTDAGGNVVNAGVRITEPLLRQLRVGIRADDVSPTF